MKAWMLAAALAAVVPGALAGGIYKWVDENGVTHFGDKPTAQSESVTVRTTPAAGSIGPGSLDGEEGLACEMFQVLLERARRGQLDGLTFTEDNGTKRPMQPGDVAFLEQAYQEARSQGKCS